MTRRLPAVLSLALAVGVPAAALAGEPAPKASPAPADPRDQYVARSVAAKTAPERYALGLWCREQGLLAESTAQWREAARLDPDFAPAREALGDRKVDGRWVTPEAAMERKGLVRFEGRWILPEEKAALTATADEKARRAREEDRARALLGTVARGGAREASLAKQALASIADGDKVAPLAFALREKSRDVRLLAAAELGRIGDRRALRPLVYRALHDADADVRAACADAAVSFRDPEVLAPFARALLDSGSASVRAAAAEGIGRSGDLRGISYLVYAIEGHGGGPRAHIYTANQLSFIQDFDVEVAQTAFIADPQVGILQDGAVLDAKPVATEWYSTRVERQAIFGALRRLSKADLGDDAAAWKGWLKDHRDLLAVAAK